jgi:hypothetical protein
MSIVDSPIGEVTPPYSNLLFGRPLADREGSSRRVSTTNDVTDVIDAFLEHLFTQHIFSHAFEIEPKGWHSR